MKLFVISLLAFLLSTMESYSRQSRPKGTISNEKPSIDTSAFSSWPSVLEDPLISSDGNYVLYTIFNSPLKRTTLVIKGLQKVYEEKIIANTVSGATFNAKGNKVFFMQNGDSLGMVDLETRAVSFVDSVKDFYYSPTGDLIIYKLNSEDSRILVTNFSTHKSISFNQVKYYLLSRDGKILWINEERKENGEQFQVLSLIYLKNGVRKQIWKGHDASGFRLDKTSRQLAFVAAIPSGERLLHSICLYLEGADSAFTVVSDSARFIESGLTIATIDGFSRDGKRIYFQLLSAAPGELPPGAAKVDIWSYQDSRPQSQQLDERTDKRYAAVINIAERTVNQLEHDYETMWSRNVEDCNDDNVLIIHRKGDIYETKWNSTANARSFLVSTQTGKRTLVNSPDQQASYFSLSPAGKYVVYFDGKMKKYYCYNVISGTRHPLTEGLLERKISGGDDIYLFIDSYLVVAGWMENDAGLLMYDKFDIWLVDPEGKKPPSNLTNGYGARCNVSFKFAMGEDQDRSFHAGDRIILNAFDFNTKQNGFFIMKLGELQNPLKLSMDDCIYAVQGIPGLIPFRPKKAANANVYLVKRESVDRFPNYYWTNNFIHFYPVSDIHPEKAYNWIKSELYNYSGPGGKPLNGVLYKPENFDSTKKYPVIFLYYEQLSHEINLYRVPEACEARINIPYFVSNGYLVFTPDIHYELGEPGESALRCILTAAGIVAALPFVDSSRMGLQGHSFGAFETNYIITHSQRFAAACSGAGVSDIVSDYGVTMGIPSVAKQSYYEMSQGRMANSLWENKQSYIDNSPIFNVDKITTPLLLMHNKADRAVPFSQGLEFFNALRRMGKRAWMLQYDDGGHHLHGKSALDYTMRMKQFFDHYLKGAPAPVWMTRGVPANQKGYETGLEFDSIIPTPGSSPLLENE